MGLEQVKTEIVLVIAPHRVDMISLILRAIHLNQEAGRLDAVMCRPPRSTAPVQAKKVASFGCFRASSRRFSAIACGTFEAYSSTMVISLSYCAAVILAAERPFGAPLRAALREAPVMMSFSAVLSTTATSCWVLSSDSIMS